MSRALGEEVTWDDRKVTSVDWASYHTLPLGFDVPKIESVLINRPDESAKGAGRNFHHSDRGRSDAMKLWLCFSSSASAGPTAPAIDLPEPVVFATGTTLALFRCSAVTPSRKPSLCSDRRTIETGAVVQHEFSSFCITLFSATAG
jgi:hypothetical protein